MSVDREQKPKRGDGEYSHVLIGAAQNENGEVYIVRSQINHLANNISVLESMEIYDVLKGAKGKKMEPEVMRSLGLKKPQPDANTTDSYYTVADFLELVKENYPNILPKDVLAHFGIDASVQDDGIMFSVDDEADPDELRRELRERGNVETRRALADTDQTAFRENEDERRRIRREIRENENRPKEIAAVEQELDPERRQPGVGVSSPHVVDELDLLRLRMTAWAVWAILQRLQRSVVTFHPAADVLPVCPVPDRRFRDAVFPCAVNPGLPVPCRLHYLIHDEEGGACLSVLSGQRNLNTGRSYSLLLLTDCHTSS